MVASPPFLLDTNVVLLSTRTGSAASARVVEQFGDSTFHSAICEVSVGELLAFAENRRWGTTRRDLLRETIARLVVLPISDDGIHEHWARLYSYSRGVSLPIFNDHNDVWIAATAKVAGLTILTTDRKGFAPLARSTLLDVILLDPHTGERV